MFMSKAEYAKHKGVSRQTVYDWIEKGEVVMSGKKIDVEATEQRNSPPAQGKDTVSEMWPERTLEMTWGEFWKAVKARDGIIPAPVTDDDIQQRVLDAAGELDWEVQFLDDGGIWMDVGDAEFYFEQYDLRQNAELVIGTLRREVCYVADACPDELDNWSEAGLNALAEWEKSDHQ
ncbi:hypothetical protein QVM90_18365 [Escherichia coli]|uniref:hypothetical protein n=1 Tax=Escherichia coli TaxID=562 RepID=UPI0021FD6D15|nr:hypothetical protein [Escherichia coli]MDM9308655.1 hypothetical protein [Escherichia coli]MDM9344063.1 hypothetical protein [Escherichia coli]WJW56118.1 hypothetical protein QVM90_18365 [Escherichia coli]BDO51007.1 hypothetical protein TUM1881_35810 [Escherichia coli]